MTQTLKKTAEETGKKALRAVDEAGDQMGAAAGEMAASAAEAAETGVETVRRKAADARDTLVSGAGAVLESARDVALDKADAVRETLSDAGARLAATLERASVDRTVDVLPARVLSTVAEGLSSASRSLRERSVGELATDVRALARRHPGAFMAVAAVAGFAAARFLRASAARRVAESGPEADRGPRV
ncbi:hypothetical protein [Rhodobacter calidifons]|uniref:ElaB/YqjD/DUF883 family membrane-anchored ribosome-binding protein n=1 Tax=Rhodobacter calidifons TaxID=2715277 RepID=A0ABX0G5D8_9RHOB|nr:hypothetical protein [Rhodobacter calidifons]NHB76006.1 hypothetical protein [Rhodobacter calidifons]